MNFTRTLRQIASQEDINFLLTNRIPRIALTRFMGWFSQRTHPWVRDLSLWTWQRLESIQKSFFVLQNQQKKIFSFFLLRFVYSFGLLKVIYL